MSTDQFGGGDESSVPLVSPQARTYSQFSGSAEEYEASLGHDVFQEPNGVHQTGTSYSYPSHYTGTSNNSGSSSSSQNPSGHWVRRDGTPDYPQSYQQTGTSTPTHSSEARSSRSNWQQMKITPRKSFHDPFTDSPQEPEVIWSASPLDTARSPTTNTTTRNEYPDPVLPPPRMNSKPSSPYTSAHDYDPEGYAMDSSPGKLYSNKHNQFPRSRSPTPAASPPKPRLPSTLPSGLIRRAVSGKENTTPTTQPRSKAFQYAEAGYESDPEPIATKPRVAPPPVSLNSPRLDTTQHFGAPPRKQRRRNPAGGKKKIPLMQ